MAMHPLLGTIVVDPEAAKVLRDGGVQLWDCLASHLDGDLGDTAVTGTLGRAQLWSGPGVRSSYPIGRAWVEIDTDLCRRVTTVRADLPIDD
ncbi:MAG TPA: hypothetical protein VKV21_14015 [Solirubrobacteraceae bacterium]|nr:hypothetical protein [Solirubrobacteraceae bacterium]